MHLCYYTHLRIGLLRTSWASSLCQPCPEEGRAGSNVSETVPQLEWYLLTNLIKFDNFNWSTKAHIQEEHHLQGCQLLGPPKPCATFCASASLDVPGLPRRDSWTSSAGTAAIDSPKPHLCACSPWPKGILVLHISSPMIPHASPWAARNSYAQERCGQRKGQRRWKSTWSPRSPWSAGFAGYTRSTRSTRSGSTLEAEWGYPLRTGLETGIFMKRSILYTFIYFYILLEIP